MSQVIKLNSIHTVETYNGNKVVFGFWGRCLNLGFSEGVYSSLNGSKYVGDNVDVVDKNLNVVRKQLHAKKLVTLKQIHSNKCIFVDKSSKSDQEADAMVTNCSSIALGILTADCVPILFFDYEHNVIGAAHAGWKGAKAGIIENTIDYMCELGCNAQSISAIVGPCLQVSSFEVQKDFLNNFPNEYFVNTDNGLFFNLEAYCYKVISKKGINRITLSSFDVFSSPEQLFSYRYSQKNFEGICGRNISAINLL